MTGRLSVTLRAVSVRRGDKWVLRDISLRLKAGERWALIGGNGAGKTQLLKLIATDVWPTPTGSEVRTYRVGRRKVDEIEAKGRIAYVGAELQDKYARYDWNLEVADLLATGLHGTDLLLSPITRSERSRIAAMLELCGLTTLASRRFLSLSYGQKRLALLARALVRKPDWLLLDEFYNGLDRDYRQRIDGILDHARKRGQSWIVSTHRAADVPPGTGWVVGLRAGKLQSVKRLDGRDLSRLAKQADEPRYLPDAKLEVPAGERQAKPGERQAKPGERQAKPGERQAKRVKRQGELAQGSTEPGKQRAASGQRRAWRGKSAAKTKSRPSVHGRLLLRLTDADLYVDYRVVLENVNWDLRAGEHWALFGANGAGKSSFLKLLYGDLSPALGGVIERSGFPRGTPIEAWKRQVGLVSPELQTDYAVNVSVFDLVASGRYASIGLADRLTVAAEQNARRWLRYFKLLSFARRRTRELSYGQLRRALFARALAADPRILLLDEPLTGLDPPQRASMKRMLEGLMKQNITLVVAVHHPEDLPRGITHSLYLDERRAEARNF